MLDEFVLRKEMERYDVGSYGWRYACAMNGSVTGGPNEVRHGTWPGRKVHQRKGNHYKLKSRRKVQMSPANSRSC